MFHMGNLWETYGFSRKSTSIFVGWNWLWLQQNRSNWLMHFSCWNLTCGVDREKHESKLKGVFCIYIPRWIECDIDTSLKEIHVSDIWLYIYDYAWLIMFFFKNGGLIGSVVKVPFHGPFTIPHQPSTRSSWTSTWIPKIPTREKPIHQLSGHYDPEHGQWILNKNYITKSLNLDFSNIGETWLHRGQTKKLHPNTPQISAFLTLATPATRPPATRMPLWFRMFNLFGRFSIRKKKIFGNVHGNLLPLESKIGFVWICYDNAQQGSLKKNMW